MSPPESPSEPPEFDWWWRLSLPEPPLLWRVILLILTIGSFLLQILLIQRKQTINGISSLNVLWNLIIATEHLSIYIFGLFVLDEREGRVFLHLPPSAGDKFSLLHCAVVTFIFLALFIQILSYSNRRILLVATYTSFLLISIVPLMVIDSVPPTDYEGRRFLSAAFYILHSIFIYPVVTALGVLGIFCQAREILAVPFPNALSLQGLAMQAVVFTLISVTWIPSLPFPYEKLEGHYDWNTFTVWYGTVGFIIVDSFVFALGQAVLLLLALHRSSSSKATIQRGTETEPLLGHPAEM